MSETERKILETSKKEFLERGFNGTSMRRIAALAGVTTGALYGYFDSKEKIFDSLVKDSYDAVMAAYKGAHEEFAALPYDVQVWVLMRNSPHCRMMFRSQGWAI